MASNQSANGDAIEKELRSLNKKMDHVTSILDGDGVDPGVRRDVSKNTAFRREIQTQISFFKYAVGSGWILAFITVVLAVTGVI